jgi:hypothetical protein
VRTVVALAVAIFALAAASACGGGSESASGASPEEWSADVCGALSDWVADLNQRADEMQQATADSGSIPDARDRIVEFLDTTVTRTDAMLQTVEDAGAPAVDDGEAIARDLREELAKIKPVFEDARESAEALPDDPEAFVDAAQDLGSALAAGGGEVGGRLEATQEKYDSPELEKAFNEEPACQTLD